MSATRGLAQFIVGTLEEAIPREIVHESKRTLINLLAISLSAALAPSSTTLARWVEAEGASPRATVVGRGLRTSPANAALVNGYLAHLQDYDDTHFPTILHPSAPVWPAVLAAAEACGASGRAALAAFALGAEAACRVAMSVHPWHYDQGWHITGTAGAFGAAAGAGRVLGLSVDRMVHALGVAGTQAGGVREVFGSDSKAMHPARAAGNGVQAAFLARDGFTAADDIIGGRRGFWAVLSPGGHDEQALLGGFGERWELKRNGLKPYANGIVSHPLQDAVIELRNAHGLKPDDVKAIVARAHPLVLELMNRAEPRTGLEGKFSFQHCAAAALVDGAGHDVQFSDARVNDPVIAAVRARVSATPDASLAEEEAYVAIDLTDGRRVETHVERATGSPHNPMTDAALEAKFRALAPETIGADQAERLLDAAWRLDEAPDVAGLMRLASRR